MGSLHIEFFHNNSPGTERYPGTPHFTRATSQSPCLHETLMTAAITSKIREAYFISFWRNFLLIEESFVCVNKE